MAFTIEQQKVINTRQGNLLVSASAGSGKTTVMIQRVLSLLLEDKVPLESIVICTFTRAAASDMKDKLLTTLMDKAESGGEDAAVAIKALEMLPTAEISTIHSWCQRLIKTYFYAIGVDPNFDICDERESKIMLGEAIDEVVEEFVNKGDDEFLDLYEVMLLRRSDARLKQTISEVYQFARTQKDPEVYLRDIAFRGYDDTSVRDGIVDAERAKIKERYKKIATKILDRATVNGCNKLIEFVENFIDILDDAPVEYKKITSYGASDVEVELREQFKKIRDQFKDSIKKFDDYYSMAEPTDRRYAQVLVSVVKSVGERYADKKRKKAKLDYSDLEHLTCALIESEAEEIAKRYRYVFVDEYQDINPLQERIIAGLKNINTFLVGDVKQSIYAFRMCDPDIFLEKLKNYDKYGYLKPIELNANFRSTHAILNITNEVFDELMTPSFGKIDYKNKARLTAGLNDTAEGAVHFRLVRSRKADSKKSGVYAIPDEIMDDEYTDEEEETTSIAQEILRIISSKKIKDGESERHVRPSDIAVLYSSRSARVSKLYEKLRKMSINATISDKTSFSVVYEVNVLCQFMRYLTDFTDDVALVASLKSPLGAITDDELVEIRRSDLSEKSFYLLCERYAQKDNELAEKLKRFLEYANACLEYSYTHTAGETIGKVVAEKNWFGYLLSRDEPQIKTDALESFLALVNSLPYGESVYEFVRYLDDEHADYERPAAANAVRIMTIHASKGLEFPFVFLMNASKEFNFRELSNRVICDGELGVCFQNHDEEAKKVVKSKLNFAVAIKKRTALTDERMRLLYVALTRAKNELFVYATAKEDDGIFDDGGIKPFEEGKSFFDWLRPVYARHGFEIVETEKETVGDIPIFGDKNILARLSRPLDEEKSAYLKEYFRPRYIPSSQPVKKSVTAIVSDKAEEEIVSYHGGGESDDRALEKGNAYHKAMELIDFDAPFEDEWKRVSPLFNIGKLVDEERLRVAHKVVGEFVKGKKIYREKQFIYSPDGATLIQGVIDLMVVEGDKCTIVDYKTSKPETILSGAYDLQLGLYMAAAQDILKLVPQSVFIYSFNLGELVKR